MMRRKKAEKKSANYLDFVPKIKEGLRWEKTQKDVTIYIENKGVMNRIAQKLLQKPKVSQIHLDEMGNFIWPLMDGERKLIEIAELVKAEFGEKAEPLYNRLVKYVRTLETYGFIAVKPKH